MGVRELAVAEFVRIQFGTPRVLNSHEFSYKVRIQFGTHAEFSQFSYKVRIQFGTPRVLNSHEFSYKAG